MSFFDKVTEMSWANPGIDETRQSYRFSARPARRVALVLFLAVVTSLFFLLVMAYSERMELADWDPVREPGILWFNSVLLVLASMAMQQARNRAVAGLDPARWLAASGVLAVVFLAGQYLAWRALDQSGYYDMASPAYAFFLLVTALHAVHLAGGLYVWARTVIRRLQGAEPADLAPTIELNALYWHYLLLLWVVLFVLLLTT